MKKATIAIDIDEVLADFASSWVAFSNKKWKTNLTVADYDEDWMRVWGVDVKEFKQRAGLHLQERLVANLQHDDAALPVLGKLNDDYNLLIVTSRPTKMREDTLQWLADHFPLFEEGNVHFAGFWDAADEHSIHKTKGELAKQLGADFLIDDQLKHCNAAAANGITSLLFGDYSWNQADSLPKGVTRVSNWAAVERFFYEQ